MMFPRNLKQFQTIQIRSLHQNCSNLQQFSIYVQNVQIDSKLYSLEYAQNALNKLIKQNPIRWVMPFRKLCMRFIHQAKIVNSLHVKFLTQAIRNNCVIQALPVVEAQAVPVKMDGGLSTQYIFLCFQVYFNLQMYQKAFKKISELISKLNREVTKQTQMYVTCYLLFCRCFNQVYVKKQTINAIFGIDVLSGSMDTEGLLIQTQKLAHLQNLFAFASGKQYDELNLAMLLDKNNILYQQIFQLSKNQSSKLKQNIAQFKADKIQRLKISQICNKSLALPQTMRSINKMQEIARYDAKQKSATQQQINQLITKCFDLNQAIKEIKVIRENQFGGIFKGRGFMGMGMGMRI